MKRLLLTASAIATLAIPALSAAHVYQDQNDARSDRHQPAQNRPADNRNAPPARPNAAPPSRQDRSQDRSQERFQDRSQQRPQDRSQQRLQNPSQQRFDSRTQRFNPSVRVQQRQNWNRGNPNWWRGRAEFRGYAGARSGFWFRPGFGYFRVDPRWYGFNWQVGGFVPFEFRSYYVQDPYGYGLPPAPYGYAYVYLGNDIALMSMDNGAIVQVFPNVY